MNVLLLSSHSLQGISMSIYRALSDAGVGVWIDWAIEEQYGAQIASYMRQSELVLFLVDAEYLGRTAYKIEWQAARDVAVPKLVLAFGDFELPEHDGTFSIERPRDHEEAAKIADSYVRDVLRLTCFVSYASADAAEADLLVAQLSMSRARTWIDRSGIPPGVHFPDEIWSAIARSKWFFLLWSARSEASTWVKREWIHAIHCGTRIVPILLDQTPLPPELETFQGFKGLEDQRLRDHFQLQSD